MVPNILLAAFIVIILGAAIYYLNQNGDQPIQNDGIVTGSNARPANPPELETRKPSDMTNSVVDDLVAQYSVEDRPVEGGIGNFRGRDPEDKEYGNFDDYTQKRQMNFKKVEQPYSEDSHDARDFSYKKKKFTTRTPEDVKDLFDVNKMLPQDVQEDWFDVEPLLTTKKIKGTHLVHPKVHFGNNTVGTSLRNATHDIRGDIANPKIEVGPWNNSTIEPDTNLKGLCNPI